MAKAFRQSGADCSASRITARTPPFRPVTMNSGAGCKRRWGSLLQTDNVDKSGCIALDIGPGGQHAL
jgi:hypothetical protein